MDGGKEKFTFTKVHHMNNPRHMVSAASVDSDDKRKKDELDPIKPSSGPTCSCKDCPFTGRFRKDIRELLEMQNELQGAPGAKRPKLEQDTSTSNFEEKVKLNVDSTGLLTLKIDDHVANRNVKSEADLLQSMSAARTLDLLTEDDKQQQSKGPALVPYSREQSMLGSLVPYASDSDESDNETDSEGEERLCKNRNDTSSPRRSQMSDEFSNCVDCANKKYIEDENEYKFTLPDLHSKSALSTSPVIRNRETTLCLSERSEADSGYYSMNATPSTISGESPYITQYSIDKQLNPREDHEVNQSTTKEAKLKEAKDYLDKVLPPLTESSCGKDLQDKFDLLFALKNEGFSLTKQIQKSKGYRNPYLLSNMLTGIFPVESYGTEYERGLHLASLWDSQSQYTNLDQNVSSPRAKHGSAMNLSW